MGVVPPVITLALSPTEWGREGCPPRYYIRRKLPHVRKELGFCRGGGVSRRDPVAAGCVLQGLVGRRGAGALRLSWQCFLLLLSLEHSLGLRWPGKVLPVPSAFLSSRRSSWCERYFFQAMLLPPRVSGRGEGSSLGKVCSFRSLEREKYTRRAARRGFPLRPPTFSGEMGSREEGK